MRAITIAAAIAALVFASGVHATTTDPRIDAVASRIAMQKVTVLCYAEGEHAPKTNDPAGNRPAPEDIGAWGYVYPWEPVEHMANEVCDGLHGILDHDPAVPLWEQALGAKVLTHESFHLRRNLGNRLNESATECRAIRHVAYTIQFLGGTPELVAQLMPWALAEYGFIVGRVSAYRRDCQVPFWPGWDGS